MQGRRGRSRRSRVHGAGRYWTAAGEGALGDPAHPATHPPAHRHPAPDLEQLARHHAVPVVVHQPGQLHARLARQQLQPLAVLLRHQDGQRLLGWRREGGPCSNELSAWAAPGQPGQRLGGPSAGSEFSARQRRPTAAATKGIQARPQPPAACRQRRTRLRHNGQGQRALPALQQVCQLSQQLWPGGQLARQEGNQLGGRKKCIAQAGPALLRKACRAGGPGGRSGSRTGMAHVGSNAGGRRQARFAGACGRRRGQAGWQAGRHCWLAHPAATRRPASARAARGPAVK